MTELKLSRRLLAIGDIVPADTGIFADVGTDHALLPIYVYKKGKAKRLILTDINNGPLEAAKKNCALYGVEDCVVSFRQGSGFAPIGNAEADVIAVCGMGGNLIEQIISEKPDVAKSAKALILSPNTHWEEVRMCLWKNNFKIIEEKTLAEEGHPYIIIKAAYDGVKREPFDFYLGEHPENFDREYIKLLIKKSESVLEHVEDKKNRAILEKLRKLL